MGLSRLENFLKSIRGTILYVDPNSLDSTDSIENQGNSLTRPFKTIQRALMEAAKFSYQKGVNNDRFGKTTILVYPGDHIIDNRPGWIPDGANTFKLRGGNSSSAFSAFTAETNFDLSTPDNALYKLNSIYGGVIVPRGTSIVGLDLRKTKIRPKYVPNPLNDNIERSTIFRVTGGCYFWQFSIFDADINDQCYKDYTTSTYAPNFSHHKLTCFEYADGVNAVKIKDTFYPSGLVYDRTDLEMYYEKIGIAYGSSIEPDYPFGNVDIEPKIDEYRIVGSTGAVVGLSSIKSGNGITPTTKITLTLQSEIPGLEVDTPFRVSGVSDSAYNGQFVVSEKPTSTEVVYYVPTAPSSALPSTSGTVLSISSDTVTSASPYIFNCSLRSVYGMCGLLADGDKASGFKSMVVAQFTGIGLQKDDNAFVIYNEETGSYDTNATPGNEEISTNSRAIYKPSYKNFHIKCINDAFIQNVSIFAIGYAEHFSVESGGDQSITNSNSNFGSKALVASGFRRNAFPQDDFGYITHIIPPIEIPKEEVSIEFNSIDVNATVGIATTNERLYLYGQSNIDSPPDHVLDGYRIGARESDSLKVLISVGGATTEYSSRIVMQNSQTSSEKSFYVGKTSSGINSIGTYSVGASANTITLTQPHTFQNGESIRIISDNGELPDGLVSNNLYYTITTGTNTNIKVAKTLNDAQDNKPITINSKGGTLKVVSRVSDKVPGEIGHPVQYDSSLQQWYVKVATSSTENSIYSEVVGLGSDILGSATSRTYITRKKYARNANDTIYRIRYVLPADTDNRYARPPSDGYVIQESSLTTGLSDSEIQTYFGSDGTSLSNVSHQRNFKFIANAEWDGSSTAKITTELPHNLRIGSQVELVNIKSTVNTTGAGSSGFNSSYSVVGITSAKQFLVGLSTNPGTFTNNTSVRDTSLPYFKNKKYNNTFYIYKNQEVQKYAPGKQDGIYYLTIVNSSNYPTTSPFTAEGYSQPVKDLYPQTNRDNPVSDPDETKSYALPSPIGEVVVNDVRNSLTKETITKMLSDSDVGIGITNIISNSSTSHRIFTAVDHGFNRIIKVGITSAGAGYGSGSGGTFYNARLVGFAGSVTGQHATAKITANASGSITDVKIMDGGSAYGIGNTLAIVGVTTTAGHIRAFVTVTGVYDNVGDTVRISGVTSEGYSGYNDLYRITSIPVGSATSFTATSTNSIVNYPFSGIGSVVTRNSLAYLTGRSIPISSISYNNQTGIAVVTAIGYHGLAVDNKVKLTGATSNLYNGDFVVVENVGLSTFKIDIGKSSSIPAVSGTIYAFNEGVTSNGGLIKQSYENMSGRMVANYAGITTSLLYEIGDGITQEVTIRGINNLDLKIGDYLQIDDEIVRIKTTIPSTIGATDPIYVFRGVLGTRATRHAINSTVRRISVSPIELRRHSIIRASGHTFEYVGFGPGNYSTAFPDKQDRQISPQEEILAQSTKRDGGVNFYSGMNDKGVSYSGNKKLSTVSGQEEIFDTPIQTITGEDIGNQSSINIISPVEGNFSRSIRVEGGPDGKAISEFNGPVIFNEKIVSNSTKGVEVNSLFIQGEETVSRKYTVGSTKPVNSGNPGDVHYNANPTSTGYLGWVYTSNNEWREFGKIGELILQDIAIPYLASYSSSSADSNSSISLAGISSYVQVGVVTGSYASTPNDFFGSAVATSADGKTIIVSALYDNPNAGITTTGLVYVFDREGGGFTQVGILTAGDNSSALDNFGYSLATSADGKTIIVGAPSDEADPTVLDTGVVYVFDREKDSVFNRVGILTGSYSGSTSDQFGFSVATSSDGKTIVVGAPNDELNISIVGTGIAYVFDRQENSFTQVGILTGFYAGNSGDNFGYSVATSGDGKTIAVGCPLDELNGAITSTGVVYVYDRSGSSFNQVGILTGSLAGNSGDNFGQSIAISGDGKTIVVGAPNDEIPTSGTESGVVYVFDRIGNSFTQVGIITGFYAGNSGDNFGYSVDTSADGSLIVVGAPLDEITGISSTGVVYAYNRQGNVFNQVGILTGSLAGNTADSFGNSVATSADGKTIIVGASNDELPTSGANSGTAYIFDQDRDTILYTSISGNVGIGSTLPTSKLSVEGNVYVSGIITAANIFFTGENSINVAGYTTTRSLHVGTGGTVLNANDNSNGNVGIGSTLPTSKLSVGGDVLISGMTTTRSLHVGAGGTVLDVNENGNGNVGIGSTLPTSKLSVGGDVTISGITTTRSLHVGAGGTVISATNISNGNVGIGSVLPTSKLSVEGNTYVSGILTASEFRRIGGTSSQFLKADGSVDTSTYLTTVGDGTLTLGVSGSGLSGSATFSANQTGNSTFTVTSSATSLNTGSTIVLRDSLGAFVAGTIDVTSVRVGVATTSNFISFRGTTSDDQTLYTHGFIGERIWGGAEQSELFIFKGNDPGTTNPGPDRIRLAAGEIRFDTYTSATSGTFDAVASSANLINRAVITAAGDVGIGSTIPVSKLDVNGTITAGGINVGIVTAERYRGINSLTLNSYQTVNPSSNVYLYSPGNDRDAWIYLDSADVSSNWGIYHRQIDSAVLSLPQNSIGFIGNNILRSYISLVDGSAYFAGSVGIGTTNPSTKLDVNGDINVSTISLGDLSYGPPTFNTLSIGTKIVLYPDLSASTVGYSLGMEAGGSWQTITNSAAQHRWYAGTTPIATLFGTGDLVLIGSASAQTFTSTSDLTQKTNINKITNPIDLTKQINGVTFNWLNNNKPSVGVIAQEVEKVLPELVHINENGTKSVNYNGIVALLIETVKEQQTRIEELERRLNA